MKHNKVTGGAFHQIPCFTPNCSVEQKPLPRNQLDWSGCGLGGGGNWLLWAKSNYTPQGPFERLKKTGSGQGFRRSPKNDKPLTNHPGSFFCLCSIRLCTFMRCAHNILPTKYGANLSWTFGDIPLTDTGHRLVTFYLPHNQPTHFVLYPAH